MNIFSEETIKKEPKEKITLLKDEEWSLIDGEVCRVIDFVPMGSYVKDGKVIAMDLTTPYAYIQIECKKIPKETEVIGFITHKVDFINLWKAFNERGIRENEEVLIIWTTKRYKNKIFKFLSRVMPKLVVMICHKNAFEILTDNNYQPELQGEARIRATQPIVIWKPEIME